jgi:hypothetical protein
MYIFSRFFCQLTCSKPDVYNRTLSSSYLLNKIFNEVGADVCREHNTQSEEIDKKQDTELKSIIKYFNNQLNLINRDWTTPKISQDQIISSKEKRISHANYKINYNLLFDGIHPRRPIARLWLHRLVKYARDLR